MILENIRRTIFDLAGELERFVKHDRAKDAHRALTRLKEAEYHMGRWLQIIEFRKGGNYAVRRDEET